MAGALLGNGRVLVVHEQVPFIASGSDHRLAQLLGALVDGGHAVTLLGRDGGGTSADRAALLRLGVELLGPDPDRLRFRGPAAGRPLDLPGLLRERRFGAVILCNWFWSGISVVEEYLPTVRAHAPDARALVLTDDVHWLRQKRHAALVGARAADEIAEGLRERERALYQAADAVLCISDADRSVLQAELPGVTFLTVRHGGFDVAAPSPPPPLEGRADLLFVGGGAVPANALSVAWFVERVLPIVRAALPEVRLHLAGAPPVGGWCPANGAVVVHGFLEDLRPLLDRSRVFVSPVLFGTGIKTKNVLALCHGVPLVTTTCGAEGMDLPAGDAALVADDPAAFAQAVIAAHEDEALWRRLSARGQAHVRRHFSPEGLREDLAAAIEALGRAEPPVPRRWVPAPSRVETLFPQLASAPEPRWRARVVAHSALADRFFALGRGGMARSELRMAITFAWLAGDEPLTAALVARLEAPRPERAGEGGEGGEGGDAARRPPPTDARS
jgi:glycosyltransferase involved in cell wall biosynthesis